MKTANSHSVKKENMRLIKELIIENHETSRVEISKKTTLTKATVSSLINELIEQKLVLETNNVVKTSGRSAQVIRLNKNAGRILSLELRSSSIYGVVSNMFGEILFEVNKDIQTSDFNIYLQTLLNTIDELNSNTKDSVYGIIGIGIGVYGIVSKDSVIKFAPFTSWKDIDLKSIIQDYTGIPTIVENESNVSALGETIVHINHQNTIFFNISIGVGMGIIINDSLYTGEYGYAGELGHTIIVPNGRPCVCGNKGCLETYISNPAILKQYKALSGKDITMKDFVDLCRHKDPHAISIYNDFIEKTSIAINNVSQMLNPKTIVLNSKIIESMPESLSYISNNLRSSLMRLDLLTSSKFKSQAIVLGLTHVIIKNFYGVKNYNIPKSKKI